MHQLEEDSHSCELLRIIYKETLNIQKFDSETQFSKFHVDLEFKMNFREASINKCEDFSFSVGPQIYLLGRVPKKNQ